MDNKTKREGKTKMVARIEFLNEDVHSILDGLSVVTDALSVKEVVLEKNELTDTSLEHLIRILERFKSVTTLALRRQRLTDVGIDLLVEQLLATHDSIKELDLRGNSRITAKGATVLGKWARNRPGPVKVALSSSFISEPQTDMASFKLSSIDVAFLAPTLTWKGCCLVHLDLSKNRIDCSGAVILGRVIRENLQLEELDLHANHINTAGWRAIFQGLLENHTLSFLNLRHNPIRVGQGFRPKIEHKARQRWPALSFLRLLLDEGSWCQTYWEPSDASPYQRKTSSAHHMPRRNKSKQGCKPRGQGHARGKHRDLVTFNFAQKVERMRAVYNVKDTFSPHQPIERKRGRGCVSPQRKLRLTSEGDHFPKEIPLGLEKQVETPQEEILSNKDHDEHEEEETKDEQEVAEKVTEKTRSLVQCRMTVERVAKKMRRRPLRVGDLERRAAIQIQAIVRAFLAKNKFTIIQTVQSSKGCSQKQFAARKIQKLARQKSNFSQQRQAHASLVIQKHVRRFQASKKMFILSSQLAKDSKFKAKEALKIKMVSIIGCGEEAANGVYDMVGYGTGSTTGRYVRECDKTGRIFLIDREAHVWRLVESGNAGSMRVLYVNKERGYQILPPKLKWEQESASIHGPAPRLLHGKQRQTRKRIAHGDEALPSQLEDQERKKEQAKIKYEDEELDDEEEGEDEDEDEEAAKVADSLRVVDSGNPNVDGVYKQAENKSEGAMVYEKFDWKHSILYTIERVRTIQNKNVWVVASKSLEDRDERDENDSPNNNNKVHVYYINVKHGEDEEPPDSEFGGEWELGQSGALPVPIFVWQSTSEERMKIRVEKSQAKKEKKRREVEEKYGNSGQRELQCMDHAARRIQRHYRAHVLLRVSKGVHTLKELARITCLQIHGAGKDGIDGEYLCAGPSCLSNTSCATMTYVKEDPERKRLYVVERIRDGKAWGILQVEEDHAPDLIYLNQEFGYSLYPPTRGWKSTNKVYVPAPNLKCVEAQRERVVERSNSGSSVLLDRNKTAVFVTDSGLQTVHGRYEEHGRSDGAFAYRCNRDKSLQVRRCVHGESKLWILVRVTSPEEPNIIYFYNISAAEQPPEDNWMLHSGLDPCPLVVFQQSTHL